MCCSLLVVVTCCAGRFLVPVVLQKGRCCIGIPHTIGVSAQFRSGISKSLVVPAFNPAQATEYKQPQEITFFTCQPLVSS